MNSEKKRFSISKRLKSFNYAFSGFIILLIEEHNSRIHMVATLLIIALGFIFNISNIEWILILFAIGFVFCLEILNTVIENLADIVSLEKSKRIKKIKDLGAAAVLFAALIAFIIGVIIFLPKIAVYVSNT